MLRFRLATGGRLRPFVAALAALTALAGNGAAFADNADVLRCRQFSEPMARLACYDRIDATSAAAPAESRKADASAFGIVKKPADAEVDTVDSVLVSALDGWYPNQVIALANGQKWEIADGSSGVMRSGIHKVRVRRGMLGTFYMEFDVTNRSPRVKRVE